MSIDLKLEMARIVEGLSIAQKKGCFNLDEAAMVHGAVLSIQKANLVPSDSVQAHQPPVDNTQFENEKTVWENEKNQLLTQRQQILNEREQFIQLLEEYKKAIEEFKKKHDEQVFQLKVSEEKIKELKLQMNIFEKENAELRHDLTELVNADVEEIKDEVIPVVKSKPKKKKVSS